MLGAQILAGPVPSFFCTVIIVDAEATALQRAGV